MKHLRLAPRARVRAGEGLLSSMWDAEHLGQPAVRGGVPSTVHVLVYLLRHLLGVTEIRRGDCYSAGGREG